MLLSSWVSISNTVFLLLKCNLHTILVHGFNNPVICASTKLNLLAVFTINKWYMRLATLDQTIDPYTYSSSIVYIYIYLPMMYNIAASNYSIHVKYKVFNIDTYM